MVFFLRRELRLEGEKTSSQVDSHGKLRHQAAWTWTPLPQFCTQLTILFFATLAWLNNQLLSSANRRSMTRCHMTKTIMETARQNSNPPVEQTLFSFVINFFVREFLFKCSTASGTRNSARSAFISGGEINNGTRREILQQNKSMIGISFDPTGW